MEKKAPPPSELPTIGFLRQSQIIPALIPFSSATLWRKVKAGTFPAPDKLSERVTAWRVEEVRKWMQARSPACQASPAEELPEGTATQPTTPPVEEA